MASSSAGAQVQEVASVVRAPRAATWRADADTVAKQRRDHLWVKGAPLAVVELPLRGECLFQNLLSLAGLLVHMLKIGRGLAEGWVTVLDNVQDLCVALLHLDGCERVHVDCL